MPGCCVWKVWLGGEAFGAIGDDCFRFDRSVRTCQQPRTPRALRRGSSSLSGCVQMGWTMMLMFLCCCVKVQNRAVLRVYELDVSYCSLQVHGLVQRSHVAAKLCCAVLCRAVLCWEAKASGSHLLLRHLLQLLLSREIAAPKLLNPASLSSSDPVASGTRLVVLRCCDDSVSRAAADGSQWENLGQGSACRSVGARSKGFAMAIFAGILPQ